MLLCNNICYICFVAMGNLSSRARRRRPTEEKSVSGLLSLEDLETKDYDIENLVFANCGAEGFSYAGSMRVLEKLCLLQRVKRFSGVGTGAVVATLLAIGLDSKELQVAFNEHLQNVQNDDELGYESFATKYTEHYGWNYGTNFFDWFDKLLESKSFDTELTFVQFYDKTDKELCLLVTNVNKLKLEYCHPKTTPDLAIKQALFMAISTPGVFAPTRYGSANDTSLYVTGALTCNYPVYCFDGWFLSMDSDDSFLNKLESPEMFYMPQVFDSRNPKTLGFFPLDKLKESSYVELVERLASANADLKPPRTTLGFKYKCACQNRATLAHKFSQLKKACSTLLRLAEDLQDDQGNIPLNSFADKVFGDKSFTKSDRLLFPEIGRRHQDLNAFLLTLADEENSISQLRLKLFIQTKLLTLLNQYPSYYRTDINTLRSYFEAVFDSHAASTTDLSKLDYDRTVGIVCRHVGPQDVDFEDDDQSFLYRQGWNATVCYFRNLLKPSDDASGIKNESDNSD